MDLIERYLGAVRWNLPAGKADDIVAELRDLIGARVEDREETRGRPLTADELRTLLKDFGHPLAVAGQYHEQRALIGAALFPFYWFVLRIVLAIVVVIELIQLGVRMIGGDTLVQALAHGLGDTLSALLYHGAIVTLAFAVIERAGWLDDYLRRWSPESLPTLPQLATRPRRAWEQVFGAVFGVVFLIWWVGGFPFNPVPHESKVAIEAGPVWATLYWPVIGVVVAGILGHLVALLAPTMKPLRAVLVIASAAGTAAIAAIVYRAGQVMTVTPLEGGAAQAEHLQDALDLALSIGVPIVGVVVVVQCLVELWQLYREPR